MQIIYQIKKDLAQKVEFGKSISFNELLLLYNDYQELLPFSIFATEVMNISEPMLKTCRDKRENIKISPFFSISDETIEIIREEVKRKFKTSHLTYKDFKECYLPYQSMIKEKEFAKVIFNINDSFFCKLKSGQNNAVVFRNNGFSFITYYNDIYQRFYSRLHDTDINYQEFLILYKDYKSELNEADFAACLGIDYNHYRTIKRCKRVNGEGYRAKLFAIPKINFEGINIEQLIKQYSNRRINYDDFTKIYKKYGNGINESYFARLLGIQFCTFPLIKNGKNPYTIILKRELTKEEKETIVNECKQRGLSKRQIDYKEFYYYYEPYKGIINKTEFAYAIGITQRALMGMKDGSKPIALDFDNEDYPNKIKQELKEYHYQRINYEKFSELKKQYKDLSERQFAYYLGIYMGVLSKLKNNPNFCALIDFYKTERLIIKHILKNKTKINFEEFEKLSSYVDLDIKSILILYFGENNVNIAEKYYEALLKNKALYLGNMPFQSANYAEKIIEICQKYAKAVCIIIECKEVTDEIANEAISYSWENMGNFELNFGESWIDLYQPYIVGFMKKWATIYKSKKIGSLNKKTNNNLEKIDLLFTNDDIEITEDSSSQYALILEMLNNGYSFEEITSYISQKTNKSSEEIIEYVKKYMKDNDLLATDCNGNISLKYQ